MTVSDPGSLPPFLVIAGPAGVGKGTVSARVRALRPDVFFSVSATTRPPRPGEVHGQHYFFVTDEEFDALVAEDQLLEWAWVHRRHRYGTPRQEVVRRLSVGQPVLLEIDIDGARQVKSRMPAAELVFLAPPSWEELERRLAGRGTESPEDQANRLRTARDELAAQEWFDHVIVNDRVDLAAEKLVSLLDAQPQN